MVLLPFFQNFSVPAGLLLYPLTFFLSDLVTEVYGATRAKKMVYLAFGLSVLSCFIITITLLAPSPTKENYQQFQNVFCFSGVLLIASLTAYVVSQIVDIHIYSILKLWTGEPYLWLRNNGSTLIAQLMDTTIVNFIHLYLGMGMEGSEVISIIKFSYTYKCIWSVMMTPFFYCAVSRFKNRLLPLQI